MFRKAQKMRKKLLKLLKKCLVDTVVDCKLRTLAVMDPPMGLPKSGCYCSKVRKKAWTTSVLSLASYALKKATEVSNSFAQRNPFSRLNRCKKMVAKFMKRLDFKSQADIHGILQ